MDNQYIIERIKSSFCNLTTFKLRTNALEVITAYSTMNSKFVSVFVTFVKSKIIVTDNGWVDQNYYDTPLYENSEDIIDRVTASFMTSFNIKSTFDQAGVKYYYKTCENIDQIPSTVFDLASFITGIVNAFCIQYKDEKEEKERETFRKDANSFFKMNYADSVKLKASLDDYQSIKFNAIIDKSSKLYLFTYVTGSKQAYFENDLRKSIVNFEIAAKSKYGNFIKEKISIINDQSDGFQPNKSTYIFELLQEKTTRAPIKWTEREQIFELVN
jgi:hypothetical protein